MENKINKLQAEKKYWRQQYSAAFLLFETERKVKAKKAQAKIKTITRKLEKLGVKED